MIFISLIECINARNCHLVMLISFKINIHEFKEIQQKVQLKINDICIASVCVVMLLCKHTLVTTNVMN